MSKIFDSLIRSILVLISIVQCNLLNKFEKKIIKKETIALNKIFTQMNYSNYFMV
jgi:hypothetical protein